MKYFILIILLTIIPLKFYCQNLIHNAGFEQGNYEENNAWGDPTGKNFDKNLQYNGWKSRYNESGNCIETWHSPDWFKCDACSYTAHSGNAYVGMRQYEVMQQELQSSNHLQPHTGYVFKLFIKIPTLYDNWSSIPVNSTADNAYLRIYLAKGRIDYKHESRSLWGCDDFCSGGYKTHQDGPLQHIIEINQIDLANYPKDQWVEIKFLYLTSFLVSGPAINDYNWFALELVDKPNYNGDCKTSAIYIDDISIEETQYCNSDPCSRTDGPINVNLVSAYGSNTSTFCLTGLDNITSLSDIRLYDRVGETTFDFPTVYSVNGISNPYCFNLPTDLVLTPDEYYSVDFTAVVYNDCGIYHNINKHLTVPSPFNTTPLPSFTPYNNSIRTPLPCCSSQPVIYLNNQTITGPGNVELIAQDAIYANNVTITDDVDYVHFQAGNSIELTTFISGDNFVAEIVSCSAHSNYRLAHNPVDTNNTTDNFISADVKQINNPVDYSENTSTNNEIKQNNSLQGINSTSKPDKPAFVVQPNPNNGKFKISINDFSSNNFKVQIRDVLGKTIYYNAMSQNSSIIDIASSPAGIYFITVCVGKDCWFDKIIKE